MKKIILSALILGSIISCSNNDKVINQKPGAKKELQKSSSDTPINLEQSLVYWKGTKAIGGGHQGTVKFSDGVLNYENNVFKNGKFSIDMTTIACSDIKDEDSNADLVGHLMSDDFFSVNQFPQATVEILKAVQIGENKYNCAALVQIKEAKKKIEFEVESQTKDSKHILLGKLKIDRTEFGVVYNSSNFFKSLGDKVINDDIMIKFEIIQK